MELLRITKVHDNPALYDVVTHKGEARNLNWSDMMQVFTITMNESLLPESSTASDNDWIAWMGGDCPVPFGTRVDVKQRDGTIISDQQAWGRNRTAEQDELADVTSYAAWIFWKHDDTASDIVAYRIAKGGYESKSKSCARNFKSLFG